jgi:uncharacterized protein YjiS (DUF1127 family)
MTQISIDYRQSVDSQAPTPAQSAPSPLRRFRRWISEWRQSYRRARSEAILRQKLEAYDDHLLRDIGLVRLGEGFDAARFDWNSWR